MITAEKWTENQKWVVVNGAGPYAARTQPVTPPPAPKIEAIAPVQVAAPVEAPTVDASAELAQTADTTRPDEVMQMRQKIAQLEKDLAFYKGEVMLWKANFDREHKQRLISDAGYRAIAKRLPLDQQDKTRDVVLAQV